MSVFDPAWQAFVALPQSAHWAGLATEVSLAATSAMAIGARVRLSFRRTYFQGKPLPSILEQLAVWKRVPAHDKDDEIHALQAVNEWAYKRPKLLRLTQSPAWAGVFLASVGAVVAHVGLLLPSHMAHAWGANMALQEPMLPQQRVERLREQTLWIEQAKLENWVPVTRWAPSSDRARNAREGHEEVVRGQAIAGVGFSLFLIGGLFAVSRVMRENVGDRQHGRAAWASRADVVFSKKAYFKIPMRVSQKGKRVWEDAFKAPWTVLAPSSTSNASHGILLGPTGAGKGAYTLGHIFGTATVPILYQDSKSETPARHLRPDMLRFGISAKKPKGLPSMRFDPIAEIQKGTSPNECADRARDLANLLLPAPQDGKGDNSWIKETAQPLLAEALLRGRWKHLGEMADEIAGRALPRILADLGLPEGWLFSLQGKNAMEYASNEISNNTQPYLRGWARHAFSASDFELEDVFEQGCYIMSATEDDQQKIPIRLFWNLIWSRAQRSDKKMPCLVLIDEAVAAGRIPGIIEATVKLRDRGFSIWMAFQTYAGIETVYGRSDAETLRRALVNSIVLTNGLDPKDAMEVTRELGNYTHTEHNKASGTKTRTAFPLLPQSDLNDLAGQESEFWGIFRGRGISKSGRPVIGKLNGIEPGLWNCLASDEEWAEALEAFGHNHEPESRFRFLIDPTFIKLSQRATDERARTALEHLAEIHGLDGLEDRAAKLLSSEGSKQTEDREHTREERPIDRGTEFVL